MRRWALWGLLLLLLLLITVLLLAWGTRSLCLSSARARAPFWL